MKPPLLLLAALLGLAQCKKKDPDPTSGLPAATQEGRNTFGCLVDGQVWIPNGNNGTSNYRLTFDPGYAGGSLGIRAYRYVEDSKQQYINIGGAPVAQAGIYAMSEAGPCGISYYDDTKATPCNEYRYANLGCRSRGTLTITRLDLRAGIIAGTFNVAIGKPGCDSVHITHGRFDYKL